MDIRGKIGAWLNQYQRPPHSVFVRRALTVDYIIIKYGLGEYEELCRKHAVPWLAEIMAETGAGSQNAWTSPDYFAKKLAAQANQGGCVGAVINLEEADGGWHLDTNGKATRVLIETFRRESPGKPLYACLDTRGNRPDYGYQRVCAELCDGVMPMVYPKSFGQSPDKAFQAAVTPAVLSRWKDKLIIPAIQAFGSIGPEAVARQLEISRQFSGVSVYTLGHATDAEWEVVATHKRASQPAPAPQRSIAESLLALRLQWVETLAALALKGTPDELIAFGTYWKNLGKGVK